MSSQDFPPKQAGSSPSDLDSTLDDALRNPDFDGHPLRDVISELFGIMSKQVMRLERITLGSSRQPSLESDSFRQLVNRYERQINRLEKAIRISDRYQIILNDLNRALQQASTHDQLTGLPNRKLMADFCGQEDDRVARDGTTYSLLAIDADQFKLVNDTYGHEVGDRVLIALANSLKLSIRDGDYCARWGGEEFLCLLVGADLATAQLVSERLLNNVREVIVECGSTVISPRVSIGVAQHCLGESYPDVYRRADLALLAAKQAGRDRFLLAGAPAAPA